MIRNDYDARKIAEGLRRVVGAVLVVPLYQVRRVILVFKRVVNYFLNDVVDTKSVFRLFRSRIVDLRVVRVTCFGTRVVYGRVNVPLQREVAFVVIAYDVRARQVD